MKYFLAILLLAFVSAKSVKGLPTNNLLAQATVDQSLAKYLLQPRGVINDAANPAVSAACFAKYLPMLSEVASTFSTQYQACITLADQRTTNLTNQAAQSMTDFKADAATICTSFQTCDAETNVLSFFDCYSNAATKDVSVVYDISNSALTAANTLSVGLRTIQQDEAQCQNATEQTYVTDTAATYQLLDQCLAAGDVSTIAPVTVQLPNANAAFVVLEKSTQCSNDAGTHTQTSADGSQTQSQTGPGCQTQSTGDDDSSSTQNQSSENTSDSQTQSSSFTIQCPKGTALGTQIVETGSQIHIKTGAGCQLQSSGNDSASQSQSQSGRFTIQCPNGSGMNTQIFENGSQIQIQTGAGCQIHSSDDGSSSQSQSQTGGGTQSQCSGADCGEFKPFPPLFTFAPMAPFPPMHFD